MCGWERWHCETGAAAAGAVHCHHSVGCGRWRGMPLCSPTNCLCPRWQRMPIGELSGTACPSICQTCFPFLSQGKGLLLCSLSTTALLNRTCTRRLRRPRQRAATLCGSRARCQVRAAAAPLLHCRWVPVQAGVLHRVTVCCPAQAQPCTAAGGQAGRRRAVRHGAQPPRSAMGRTRQPATHTHQLASASIVVSFRHWHQDHRGAGPRWIQGELWAVGWLVLARLQPIAMHSPLPSAGVVAPGAAVQCMLGV